MNIGLELLLVRILPIIRILSTHILTQEDSNTMAHTYVYTISFHESRVTGCTLTARNNLSPILVVVKVGRLSADSVHDVWDTDDRIYYCKNRRIVESLLEAIRFFGRLLKPIL
jgi:hypothetical protein